MIRIVEVGPRDGLQNEPTSIPTRVKSQFIADLAEVGLKEIEATSFVHPKAVPQLADADDLWPMLSGAKFSALVPNSRGLDRARALGVDRIAVFTAASSAFTEKNIRMTIDESLAVFKEVIDQFHESQPNGWVRGYLSTVFECPYAGPVSPEQVKSVTESLFEMGVDEVSLGDTIGVGSPKDVAAVHQAVRGFDQGKIAWHFHDTRGTAIANTAKALELGYTIFDASAGGLGGCPYAPGAGGNLATEDLVYFLEREGIETGIDLKMLAQASLPILEALGRPAQSKAQLAVLAAHK
jgi:hydroxymethylglutaryl-CoA lyase